ncbi:MAG: asparagine synthase (glutamine-hydrolyzing) [Calditerrivibrio sp.]|nr:asparagine synthase (glutamine-hydrolyzing) [Calditerrivibrio sp.]
MCGIFGINYFLDDRIINEVKRFLYHRGPDDNGFYRDEYVTLVHTRLSIIDLSVSAHQPMRVGDKVIVYNGEIYNYIEIRKILLDEGISFTSNSDTEVLLKGYIRYGEKILDYLNGDFAFCIYDIKSKFFFLARDRLGNKPLYYYLKNGTFIFASEIKVFGEFIDFEYDIQALGDAILFNINDYSSKTIFKDILNFPQAHYGFLDTNNQRIVTKRYWNVNIDNGAVHSEKFSERKFNDYLEEFENLIINSIKLRFRSEVPIGVLLSGGIDSTLIAIIVKKLCYNVDFYSALFPDFKEIDETCYVEKVSDFLNILVNKLIVPYEDVDDDIKDLVKTHFDIIRNFSIYAQYCVFRELSKKVKVSISGQGSDELFGGYYHHVARYIVVDDEFLLKRRILYGDGVLKEIELGMSMLKGREFFFEYNQKFVAKIRKVIKEYEPNYDILLEKFEFNLERALYFDTTKFILPTLLRYEDRNSMRFSVESRTPFTDYRIVEFALKLPLVYKMKDGYTKFILRKLIEKYGLKDVAFRLNKIGFEAPNKKIMECFNVQEADDVDIRLLIFKILDDTIKKFAQKRRSR